MRLKRGPALPALFLTIAAGLVVPGSAAAGATMSLLGLGGRYHSIERLPSGATANKESGDVGGQELRASLGDERLRWTARWQRWHDAVAYRGATQIGLPINTVTALGWTDVAFGVESTVWRHRSWRATLDAGFGHRTIHRHILPTFFSTPLTETLDSSYALAGARISFAPLPAWTLSARSGLELPLKQRLGANFHGLADPVTLAPHRRASWVHELSLDAALNQTVHLTLGWRLNALRIGHSGDVPYRINGQDTGSTVRYPGSTQDLDMMWLGVSIQWP